MCSEMRSSWRMPKRGLTDQGFAYLLIIPLLIFSIGIVLYPLAYSIWISLNNVDFYRNRIDFVGLGQYIKAFQDPYMAHYAATTARFSIEVIVLTLSLGLGSALLLNETFPGNNVLRVVALLPWAMSEYATAVIWRYLYSAQVGFFNGVLYSIGLISSYVNILGEAHAIDFVAVAYSWHFAPLIAFFTLAGLQTIPEDLYKAVKIDGGGALTRFLNVTLPHLRYTLLISLVLVTMEAARATDIVLILTGGGPGIASETLTYHIYRLTFLEMDISYGAAVSYILTIAMFATTILYFYLLTRKK